MATTDFEGNEYKRLHFERWARQWRASRRLQGQFRTAEAFGEYCWRHVQEKNDRLRAAQAEWDRTHGGANE